MAAKQAGAPTIAFVTVSKGRLHHLKQTLPLMAAQQPDELIVVDYSCPDDTGGWAEANCPSAKIVRVPGESGFNISRARNLGAAAAKSDWLFFVDADVICEDGLLEWVKQHAKTGAYFRQSLSGSGKKSHAWGSFACRTADFVACGGYDDVLEGWGWEDDDLYQRLRLRGIDQVEYPFELASAINHGDDDRHLLPGIRTRWENHTINGCYVEAKRQIAQVRRTSGLRRPEREQIMEQTRRAVIEWFADGASSPISVRYIVSQDRPHAISPHLAIATQVTVTVLLAPLKPFEGR